MTRDIAAMLERADLFDNLSSTQCELVASIGTVVTLTEGEILFSENAPSDDVYVILRGGIDILLDPGLVDVEGSVEAVVIARLHAGQTVGEIALVDKGVRSATARAAESDTHLLRLERGRLMTLCDTYPELGYRLMRNVAADLALKIRNADLTMRRYQLLLYRHAKE